MQEKKHFLIGKMAELKADALAFLERERTKIVFPVPVGENRVINASISGKLVKIEKYGWWAADYFNFNNEE